MPSDDFPNAPDVGREFFNNKRFAPPEQANEQEPATPQHYQELDHLELTLDYTPGGELEQDVHTQLSDNARREFQERMQKTEPPRDDYYINQIQDRFDKQIEEVEREREQQEERERDGLPEQDQQQENDQFAAWQFSNYEMPEQSQEPDGPALSPPPHDGGAKLRPGRSDRNNPEHTRDEHEH